MQPHNLKKKPNYPVIQQLRAYLHKYDREITIPISYSDLKHYSNSFAIIDEDGKDTLWESVMYLQDEMAEINLALTKVYALLKTDGDLSVIEHLKVQRIDYCTFGNSNPFRIRIVNKLNDNYDYFYIKKADASRIYGLELEHILSPNRINFMVDENTLVEEHIAGIPGDMFMSTYMKQERFNSVRYNKVRIAKEFVKFNERCFLRLLGDMRSYNYVVDITPDFEMEQYRIRAIDFDQQSYEGKKTLYLPQFYKENNDIVSICMELLNPQTVKQYQFEERTLILRRVKSARKRLKDLMDSMRNDEISTSEKISQLKTELNQHYGIDRFSKCKSMGDLVRMHLLVCLKSAQKRMA
jgi:hypothetical protein